MIKVFAQTDVGRVREGNEDNFLVGDITSEHLDVLPEIKEFPFPNPGLTLMVSDGMGGAAAGEVASELAVKTTMEHMQFDEQPTEVEFVEHLNHALETANRVIAEHARQHPEMRGMGATATAAGILGSKVWIGQVGDSRAYWIRGNRIIQITKDQSFVGQLVEAGKITEEEAESHPRRNVILQALGNQTNLKIEVSLQEIEVNDYLLLCSDGLSGLVRKEEILDIVSNTADPLTACSRLISLANERGGHDNITVVLAHFVDSVPVVEKESKAAAADVDDTNVDMTRRIIAPGSRKKSKAPSQLAIIAALISLISIGVLTYFLYQRSQAQHREHATNNIARVQAAFFNYLADQRAAIDLLPTNHAVLRDTVNITVPLNHAREALYNEAYLEAAAYADSADSQLSVWQQKISGTLERLRSDDELREESIRWIWRRGIREIKKKGHFIHPAIALLSDRETAHLDSLSFDSLKEKLGEISNLVFASALAYIRKESDLFTKPDTQQRQAVLDSLDLAKKRYFASFAQTKYPELTPQIAQIVIRQRLEALQILADIKNRLEDNRPRPDPNRPVVDEKPSTSGAMPLFSPEATPATPGSSRQDEKTVRRDSSNVKNF